MRIIPTMMASVLALGSTALADKAAKPKAVDPIAASLTRLRDAAKCTMKASPWRSWCPATDFAKGTAPALPTKTLVGMTVELEDGKDVAQEALVNKVTFVALAIDKDGKVKLTDVKPENGDEAVTVNEAIIAVNHPTHRRDRSAVAVDLWTAAVSDTVGIAATSERPPTRPTALALARTISAFNPLV